MTNKGKILQNEINIAQKVTASLVSVDSSLLSAKPIFAHLSPFDVSSRNSGF